MFNKTIDLIIETYTTDDLGQQIATCTYRKVYVKEKSIPQSEFFLAGQTEIKPATCFIVRQVDYKGEKKLRYSADNGDVYSIYRTYKIANECIELYCEVRSNG